MKLLRLTQLCFSSRFLLICSFALFSASLVYGQESVKAAPDNSQIPDTSGIVKREAPHKTAGEILLDIPEEILKTPVYVAKGLGYAIINPIYRNHTISKIASYALSFKPSSGIVPLASYGSNSGVYLGLAYRDTDLLTSGDLWELKLAFSTHDYQKYSLEYRSGKFFRNTAGVGLMASYRYRPRESFYGLGSGSRQEDEFALTFEESSVVPEIYAKVSEKSTLRAFVGYRKVNIFDGKDQALDGSLTKNLEKLHLDPAVVRSSELGVLGAAFEFDWRDSKGQPSRGGKEMITASYNMGDNADGEFSYWETRVEVAHYLNLYKKRILAARVIAKSVDIVGATPNIPFYLRSTLGGVDDLRGYRKNRFVDDDMILATLEYRYPIWKVIDAVAFLDEGRVTSSLTKDLSTKVWHNSYGMGLRVWRDDGVLVNLTVARSDEGTRFYFELGQEW